MKTLIISISIIFGALIISNGISESHLPPQDRIELKHQQQEVTKKTLQEQQKVEIQLVKEKAAQQAEQQRISEKVDKYGKESLSEQELKVWDEFRVNQFVKTLAVILKGLVWLASVGTLIIAVRELWLKLYTGKHHGI
ncbi:MULTISPECIES: hypothetical protein [Photobacterium]|uniref:Uncharacterized protein n=1 Tax=Photobacterium carnosum TaxID=2023717 RepID=A0A2N4UM53_9GAMM|nr:MULTISPECIES: hypothetical protein [Photobacterium]MBY3789053.1 hypothetical protein [Photobacterium carnosum]MCD9465486.1 hypothetical protein [Photobacterium phosphoreum]MCD9480077.1 hypothetical protein [Photobacterium phosphoreum]MCD9513218.1 hypothetical protein [Photobacterium phosphoreum]MCD9535697.1 hypothetical protein [Photobacterium carnosum]